MAVLVVQAVTTHRPAARRHAGFREWRPLAKQGVAEAQYKLGVMCYTGQGVPQDHAQAVRWYRPAAWQGNVYAQYNLGIVFMLGQGVPQDYVQAYKFLTIAASRFPPASGAIMRSTIAISLPRR